MERSQPLSFPKDKIKVLLLENIHPLAKDIFEAQGFPVETVNGSMPENKLRDRLDDVYVLGIRSRTQITPGVLDSNRLIALGAYCIGTDQIDLAASTDAGVAVFNAPYSNTRSVAELALGQMILLSRGIVEKDRKMHQGVWDKSAKNATEVRGKTLGIIGYGKIGSQLSVLAESLGMNVCFYNTSETLALGNARNMESMDEVLQSADIVSIHVSGETANKNLISSPQFDLMRDGAVFLNLSRGCVVDQDALAKNLKSGKLKGAAVDVYPAEPAGNGDEFVSPLRGLPNVILTPHIGGSTEEAQVDIARFVSQKLISFVNTGDTRLSVNLPNVELPPQSGSHRFLHLHRNTPGVMANINAVFADRGINIFGQYLKTNDQTGYVITDVADTYDKSVKQFLRSIPGTIKFRVLY